MKNSFAKGYLTKKEMEYFGEPVGMHDRGPAFKQYLDPITATVATIGAGLIGSKAQSNAANRAVDAQTAAADQANAEQRRQYDQTRLDNQPFRETGVAANNRLSQLMGLSEGGENNGSLTRRFNQSDLVNDAVYQNGLQFGLNQGVQGLNRQAAANGSFLSGAALKALTRFGNDYGTTKANESYNRYNNDQSSLYNRYAGLSGAGQQATNQVSVAGQNMANNVSQNMIGAGNARGSGYIAQGNAIQNALNGGIWAARNWGGNYNSMGNRYGSGDVWGANQGFFSGTGGSGD